MGKTRLSVVTPERVLNSIPFKRAKTRAQEYARDPAKAQELIEAALIKAEGQRRGALTEVWYYLTAQIRLIRAYARREYTDVSWETILAVVAAILYFVMPVDLIPDFVPGAGYIDDVAVISFLINSIKTDLNNFLIWENRMTPYHPEAG